MPNYLLRITFSIFINIVFTFILLFSLVFWLENSFFFALSLSVLSSLFFGFFNGLITGLLTFRYTKKQLALFGFSFAQSFLLSIFWSTIFYLVSGFKDEKHSSISLALGAAGIFGIIGFITNSLTLILLKKFLPDKSLAENNLPVSDEYESFIYVNNPKIHKPEINT